jgi:uncharacterized membrane protein YfcA
MKMLLALVLIGLFAGVLSGFVGVGGGLIIVPSLVYLLGYTQLQAQGTSLAVLLLPVGFLAVWNYYKMGNINVSDAIIIAFGFVIGAHFGSKWVHQLKENQIKFFFGLIMFLLSLRITISSGINWFDESKNQISSIENK